MLFGGGSGGWEGSPCHCVPAVSPQAQVAFLQGERKGQENLKTDLVRRIKMLEYALKQERWVTPQNSVFPHSFWVSPSPPRVRGATKPHRFGATTTCPPPPLPSRSKYHKLKFGTELTLGEKKPEGTEPGECACPRQGCVCEPWVLGCLTPKMCPPSCSVQRPHGGDIVGGWSAGLEGGTAAAAAVSGAGAYDSRGGGTVGFGVS